MTESPQGPSATIEIALAHATRLLAVDPVKAEQQSRAILEAIPDHPHALYLLGAALRGKGDAAGAKEILEPLARAQSKSAATQLELGLALAELGEGESAIAALRRAAAIDPNFPGVWQALADQFTFVGDKAEADRAYMRQIEASAKDRSLLQAATALLENKVAIAERLIRNFLKRCPTDIAAMRMLAEVGARIGAYEDAERLLQQCLELAPSFTAARFNYAIILHRQNKSSEALDQIDALLKSDPKNPEYRNLRAATLARIGEYAAAAETYVDVLKTYPNLSKVWMSYGHTLKTLGRVSDSIAAYRKSIQLSPGLGEAYWSLANLKTFRFTEAELAEMHAQLKRRDLPDEDRFHLHFAMGKALEDDQRFADSFEEYAKGNALRRAAITYDEDDTHSHAARSKALFTSPFFKERAGFGHPARDPIFIVGLPRSGSTLIEQILASHSQVEGTMELPDVIGLVRKLAGRKKKGEIGLYPEVLQEFGREGLHSLGAEYLERTQIQRKLGRPFFIDKTPHNFWHIGLIHLMLPNAKIIDARRHPLGCCFSCFKQHFARGHHFTYDLAELGHYYAEYVDLMAHFDAVLPGRIHRVIYEQIVENPEREIRRLLAHCELAFEPACLRFYETERAVRTPSSEQVRMPIFREALDQWRNYEPWLGPLKEALGPSLKSYLATPNS